jgi:hypothetical protein
MDPGLASFMTQKVVATPDRALRDMVASHLTGHTLHCGSTHTKSKHEGWLRFDAEEGVWVSGEAATRFEVMHLFDKTSEKLLAWDSALSTLATEVGLHRAIAPMKLGEHKHRVVTLATTLGKVNAEEPFVKAASKSPEFACSAESFDADITKLHFAGGRVVTLPHLLKQDPRDADFPPSSMAIPEDRNLRSTGYTLDPLTYYHTCCPPIALEAGGLVEPGYPQTSEMAEELLQEHMEEVRNTIATLLPDPEVQQVFWSFAASLLEGIHGKHLFMFAEDSRDQGNKGKSTAMGLLVQAMGGYHTQLAKGYLMYLASTNNGRAAKGAPVLDGERPTPFLCTMAGARLTTDDEVGANWALQEALVKALTGGTPYTVSARVPYGDTVKFAWHATILLAFNASPEFDKRNDMALIDRFRVVGFGQKFAPPSNPMAPTQVKESEDTGLLVADHNIKHKLVLWRLATMRIMLEEYPAYVRGGRVLAETAEMKAYKRHVIWSNDDAVNWMKRTLSCVPPVKGVGETKDIALYFVGTPPSPPVLTVSKLAGQYMADRASKKNSLAWRAFPCPAELFQQALRYYVEVLCPLDSSTDHEPTITSSTSSPLPLPFPLCNGSLKGYTYSPLT